MLLTSLLLLPLLGAVVVFALPTARETLAKQVALVFSLATLALTLSLAAGFEKSSNSFQFIEKYDWIPSFGISWGLGVDGIAAALLVMSTILVPAVIVAGWFDAEKIGRGSVKGFFALILVLEAFMIGVFSATDVFLFYVFFEGMLIPVYFLIGRYGGENRVKAATKFLLYSLVGGLFMLASLIGLYVASAKSLGAGTFDLATLSTLDLDPSTQKLLFLGFFFAFAVKAPMVPLHTWLPDAAAEATPGTSTLLVGVLDKVGTFGMIRFCLGLFPEASKYYADAIVVLAVISIFYGALMALGQKDMLRLVAYSSVSHFGFIVLGIFAFTSQGISGSSLYMVNHGFSTGAMFLVVGFLIARRGSKNIQDFGGVNKVAPVLTGVFLLAGLSSLALPGMSSFVSEFMVLLGSFHAYPTLTIISTFGIVFAALYILWLYQRAMTGEASAEVTSTVTEINKRELAAIAPIIALILYFGVFPQGFLDLVQGTTNQVQSILQLEDPSSLVNIDASTEGSTTP